MTKVFLCAGDASGELHSAAFVRALRERLPEARFLGLGGAEMEKAGVDLIVHQRELAIAGLVEVLSSAHRIFRVWQRLSAALERERPDLVVLVDSPDFNIPFARRARRLGQPLLYYISPQIWAWRSGRKHKIARRVDRMAVIFPFEKEVYAGTGLPVDFVGHPLIERMQGVVDGVDRGAARAALSLDPEAPLLALLPGSRRNELRFGLPVQLECAQAVRARRPDVRFVVALAPSLPPEAAQDVVAMAKLRGLVVDVVQGRTHEVARAADVALAKPGTVTVELALLGCPLVVVARANALSAAIARRVVDLPSFTMVNLIAGAPIVPEFLQEKARPERVAEAVVALLDGPARELQLARLDAVRRRLGAGGAAERAAAIAEEMIRAAPA
jgi:lipid-A-disaccharide synthase